MIRLHRLGRLDHPFDDQPQELHKRELILGVVDLSTEKRDPRPIFLGVMQELESVESRPRRAAKNADDHVRVEADEFFHRPRAVVNDLEKVGPPRGSDAREHSRDHIIEIFGQNIRRHNVGHVGVEHFEEVAKAFSLGLLAKPVKMFERRDVVLQVVVERDAVKTKIRAKDSFLGGAIKMAALRVVEAGRP